MRNHLAVVILISVSAAAACSGATAAATIPTPAVDEARTTGKGERTAVFAGGCFWGIEAVFDHVKGVKSSVSGYSGGNEATAHYDIVSTGTTGHAESVQVVYDPSQISYGQLLQIFFSVHDPTELNGQGPDEGPQYRTAIFYGDDEQKRVAQAYVDQLNRAKVFKQRIVTQVVPLKAFYKAEDYHQDYLVHHPNQPYIVINDLPKVAYLREQFPQLYK